MAEDRKTGLLQQIEEKVTLFRTGSANSEEGNAIVEKLEKLYISVSGMQKAQVTKEYVDNLLHITPELLATTLEKALAPQTFAKSAKKKGSQFEVCEVCGEILVGSSCTNCGRQSDGIQTKQKGKSKDSMAMDIDAFLRQLDQYLGKIPPPKEVLDKKDRIKANLVSQRCDLKSGKSITIDHMRKAFSDPDLRTQYGWCVRMRFEITGYRPNDFTLEERQLFQKYYVRSLEPFSKLISSATSKGPKKMTNKWCIQAIMKVIIISSTRLMKGHLDFLDSLSRQNQNTETEHCAIWNQMCVSHGWTFE
jgi:hypothetical protein